MDSEPPRVILDVGSPSATASDDDNLLTYFAIVAFFGTVLFCTCQALIAPRRTFCSEKMPKMD